MRGPALPAHWPPDGGPTSLSLGDAARLVAAPQVQQLLGLVEEAQAELELRIDLREVLGGHRDPEQVGIDLEAHHRLDEGQVLLPERLLDLETRHLRVL